MNKDWILKNVGRLWEIILLTGNNFQCTGASDVQKAAYCFCANYREILSMTNMYLRKDLYAVSNLKKHKMYFKRFHFLNEFILSHLLKINYFYQDLKRTGGWQWRTDVCGYRVSFLQGEKCSRDGFTALWMFLLLNRALDNDCDGKLYVMSILLKLKT